jgi:hypothetical protein
MSHPLFNTSIQAFCSARNPVATLQRKHSYMKNIPARNGRPHSRRSKKPQQAARLFYACILQVSCAPDQRHSTLVIS